MWVYVFFLIFCKKRHWKYKKNPQQASILRKHFYSQNDMKIRQEPIKYNLSKEESMAPRHKTRPKYQLKLANILSQYFFSILWIWICQREEAPGKIILVEILESPLIHLLLTETIMILLTFSKDRLGDVSPYTTIFLFLLVFLEWLT